jgi:putative copper export protein
MSGWYLSSLILHLIALALWLGGMVFFLVVFGPAVRDLRPDIGMGLLNQGRIALEGIAWVGIVLLMFTGMVNLFLRNQAMGAHLGRTYMFLLSIKLLIFVAMLAHHSLQVFKYGPRIAAMTAPVETQSGSWPEPLRANWQSWFMLLKINTLLGAIATLLGLALIKAEPKLPKFHASRET